jgi:hypothetical protein
MQIQRRPPEGGRYIIQQLPGLKSWDRPVHDSKETARFNGKGKVKGDGEIRTPRKNARRAVAGRAFGIRLQRRRLGCAGDHWAHEVDAIDGHCDAVNWRYFTRDLGAAKSSGAGTDQDGRAALPLRRKRECQFKTRAGLDGNIGVKEDAGTGDVAQLAGVILQWAVFGHADLYGQVNLVASGFSAFSHNIPPELDARREPRDVGMDILKTRRLREW